ncbi:MAG: heavy metal translocating P-type ATPase, partial [Thiothrix sp.]|nr:heavy metal translocating P-type ATPase [Thiothrix sp.]
MAEPAVSGTHTDCCSLKHKQADASSWSSAFAPFITTHEGTHHLSLHVDGIHCARCIWAIESALHKETGVTTARVNMGTGRLTLQWIGDTDKADHYAQVVESLGYKVAALDEPDKREQSEERFLLRCMAIAGFAMGNIMLLSVALWSSSQEVMGIATRDLLHWVSALIALPTIAYAGQPFFRSALAVLKKGHTNMDVPISLALILASGMSLSETINRGEHAYFDSAVMLLFFLLIGRWLDARARGKATASAESLLAMLHGTATVLEEGHTRHIAIRELAEGMIVRIAAGEKIPTDVEVIEGTS